MYILICKSESCDYSCYLSKTEITSSEFEEYLRKNHPELCDKEEGIPYVHITEIFNLDDIEII